MTIEKNCYFTILTLAGEPGTGPGVANSYAPIAHDPVALRGLPRVSVEKTLLRFSPRSFAFAVDFNRKSAVAAARNGLTVSVT